MAERVVLHIGTMKSGTSFIQNVLVDNRSLAQEQGLLFAGRRWRQQVSAVRDVIERGGPAQEPLADDGPWRSLAAEMNAWSGSALISMEFLAPRRRPKIEQIISSFGSARVEVVLTARDLTRCIPAMWQESMQNNGESTWEEFLDGVREGEEGTSRPGSWFWRHQGVADITRRWSEMVGHDRFTLVTVPGPGTAPDVLWERFCAAVGLEPDAFDLGVKSNPSIGAASALVLRALNEKLADDPLPLMPYQRIVKHTLAKTGLAARKADQSFGLDARWARRLAKREVSRLRKLKPRMVGSWEDLAPRSVPGRPAGSVTLEEQLDAAVDGLVHLVRTYAEQSERARERTP